MTAHTNNDAWQYASTPAARLMQRVMHERGWKQRDVAHATGMDVPSVSRWTRGTVNPTEARVAEMAAVLGYDPQDFGITTPAALARANAVNPNVDNVAPAWAIRQHAEVMEALARIAARLDIS